MVGVAALLRLLDVGGPLGGPEVKVQEVRLSVVLGCLLPCLPLASPAAAAEQEERGLVVEDDLSGSVPARGVNQPSQCF